MRLTGLGFVDEVQGIEEGRDSDSLRAERLNIRYNSVSTETEMS